MSLRLLYTLCFAFLVLVLSILSSVVIYQFYKNHRNDLFISELEKIASTSHEHYLEHKNLLKLEVISDSKIEKQYFNNKQIQLLNAKDSILFSYPSTKKILIDKSIWHSKNRLVIQNNFDYNYVQVDQGKLITTTIIVATDDDAMLNLKKLKFILILVSIAFTIIAFIGGNLIVITAVKPLTRLADEMKNINENNLTTPVKVGKFISETNKLAINFNNLLARLSEAFVAQKNFVQHASHELRTPLATMYATTQAALEINYTTEEYKAILQSLKQDQNNLIELTNALLLLSQFEKLRHKPTWSVIRIDDLLYDSMAYTKKLFSGMVIDFKFETIPENEAYLELNASETLLRSAFTNLIKNAFLYSNNQKTTIVLVAEEGRLEIHFENVGKHLTTFEVENLKEPFLKSENVGRVKGFGLGLSIVQRIIQIHNATFFYTAIGENKNRFTIKFK